MDANDLTTEQAERLRKTLFPHVNFLVRLKKRMEERGFHRDDKLYLEVVAAYQAANRLSMSLHYLSCKSGVWHPPRE